MRVYVHVDDLLLRALLKQREESSSDSLYANNIDVENLCQLIKLHVLDGIFGSAADSGIVDENIKRLAVELGLHDLDSLLDAGGVVDGGRDRVKTIRILLFELLDTIGLNIASDGEDFGDV
jgi:hypothetical protein